MSLPRSAVKEMGEYVLDAKPVIVFMVHKPGSGESVTLADPYPADANPYNHIRKGTMQMRKFMKHASPKEPT